MGFNLKNKDPYIILFFFAGSFLLRYLALLQTPYANGWDGYYYIMQAHSWLNYGHLQSTDYSIIYPYFTLISYLIGDYEQAYKIGSAILGGGLVICAYLFVKRIRDNIWLSSLAAVYLLFSPTITYAIVQFPKNILGLIFFILCFLFLMQRRFILSLLTFIVVLFAHRMTAGLCMVVYLIYFGSQLNWRWIVAGAISVIMLSLLPGLLHFSDFYRFSGQGSIIPQFSPFSFYQLFQPNMSAFWTFEMIIISLALLVLVYKYIDARDYDSPELTDKIIWPVLLLISIFPFFIMQSGSMGYRFFIISPVIICLYLSIKVKLSKQFYKPLIIVFLIGSLFSFKSYDPRLYDPPNKLYSIIVDRLKENYNADNYPLIIAHKSLAEMIIYKTEFDALNWMPPKGAKSDSTLRVIHGLDKIHFIKHLNTGELSHVKKLTRHYYVTTESVWNKYLDKVYSSGDTDLIKIITNGNNPLKERPDYLKKGKDL